MFNAYLIYTLSLIFLLVSSWIYSKNSKKHSIILILSILIICVVLGIRYDVGVDFLAYDYIYKYQFFDDVESGYALVNKFLFSLGLPSSSIFTLVAFFQLFLFAKGIEKINPHYLPLAFFFYFTTLYFFLSLNVLRQTLAFSIFVYSIKYIVNKQFIKYIVVILLASTIHKSAFILIPLYFVLNIDWLLEHRIFQLAGYFITYTMSIFLSEYIWSNFAILALAGGYADYADNVNSLSQVEWGKEGGLGVYLWMLIDVWVMLCFSKSPKASIAKYEISLYNIYYVGLLLSNIVAGTYLDRANLYFLNFRILVYAIFFYRIFQRKGNVMHKIIAIAVILVLILFFYMGIYNKASQCAPFKFVSF